MLIPRPTTEIPELPTPAGHRQLMPAVLEPPVDSDRVQRAERRRRILGFAVAAALHIGLVMAWFLTPPLRLKTNPAPERWVPVLSIAPDAASTPMQTTSAPGAPAVGASAPGSPAAKPKSAKHAMPPADAVRR